MSNIQFRHLLFDICRVEGLQFIIVSSILIENRIKIIKIHYENGEDVKTTYREISYIFSPYNHPFEITTRAKILRSR